jgi:Holliday junction resolvasome RuvABC DNA-binding subunit
VAAYRRAATTIAEDPRTIATIFAQEGEAGLRRIPTIGKSLARVMSRFLRQGRSKKLERLRECGTGKALLCTLPGVGLTLAQRLEDALPASSLEEVFAAARNGRLRRVPGFGIKRLRSIRESLAARLQSGDSLLPASFDDEPAVDHLLSIDEEYREKASAGQLPMATPRLFNPTGRAWLPILHTTRGNRRFTAHFVNTARSHQTGTFHDWVVITCDTKQKYGQWTVITSTRGSLKNKRIVMHREPECRRYYQNLKTQLSLL